MNTSDIFVSTDRGLLDTHWIINTIKTTPWSHWRSSALILKSVDNSLCFGLYWRDPTTGGPNHPVVNRQIGFARVIGDKATFSYICDVVIDEECRHRGMGKFLISQIMLHPEVDRTVCHLNTNDAHNFYERFGFVRNEEMRRIPTFKKS